MTQMKITKKAFNDAVKCAIRYDEDNRNDFACYPVIAIHDNSCDKEFSAYYAEGCITISGVFTKNITATAVKRAEVLANKLEQSPDYVEHGLIVAPCIIVPVNTIKEVKHDISMVIVLTVDIQNGFPIFKEYYK